MGEMTREERNEILRRHGLYRSAMEQGGVSLDAWAVARRLAAMEAVVEAARKLSDASLSMAASTSGGAAKVNVQDVVEAATAMDGGWVALDTALAALEEVG